MEEFITVEKSSPEFQSYLSGEFSKEYRALPMRSMNINRATEKVTFQIKKKTEVERPALLTVLSQVLRFDLLTLTLTPATAVAALVSESLMSPHLIFMTLLSLIFLHGATFCRNDFIDHMRGVDRLNEKGGSQVIQKGWLRAVTVQKLYWALLTIAVGFALPVLAALPELFFLSLAVAGMGVLGYSHLRWGFGHWIFGDVAVFLCLGPLLTVGMGWVAMQETRDDILNVGFYFGTLALIYVEIRHTISIVVDDEAGLSTLPVRWGFDRAKLIIVGLLMLAAFLAASVITNLQPGLLSLAGLPLIAWIFWIAHRAFAVTSPLSSGLYELPRKIAHLHFASGLYFILLSMV